MTADAITVEGPEPLGDAAVVVNVRGEVTFANADILSRSLSQALATPASRLVVDISDVPFMDSSGMSALLVASRDARADGRSVAVVHSGDEPPGIFRFKGVAKLLSLHTSRADAAP